MRTIVLTLVGIFWLSALGASNFSPIDLSQFQATSAHSMAQRCSQARSKSAILGPEDFSGHIWIKLTTSPDDELPNDFSTVRVVAFNTKDIPVADNEYNLRIASRAQPLPVPLSWITKDVYRVDIHYLPESPIDTGCVLSASVH